jgi:amino acid transporter
VTLNGSSYSQVITQGAVFLQMPNATRVEMIVTGSGEKIGLHAAWAMAVGGMIGGGIYTLAGVLLGVAGPLAWVSLALGSLIALATVHSYTTLTMEIREEGVPVTLLLRKGRGRFASLLAAWLLVVYVLALAVYAFTFAHYVGRAIGASALVTACVLTAVVGALVLVNLAGIVEPARVQIVSVWCELAILALLALIGIVRWRPHNLTAGVPSGSFGGVISGMAATFIAFEGFEMLAYDIRELRAPRRVLMRALPAAVIAVSVAYAMVTIGAASLVGAGQLSKQKENALALAGTKAAGGVGFVVVTVAACSSAASAINATLFSASRLARSAAHDRLLPAIFGRINRWRSPHWSILFFGTTAIVLGSISSLEPLVQSASLAFLLLFAFVNGMAWIESRWRSLIALFGFMTALASSVVVGRQLALRHPKTFIFFFVIWAASFGGFVIRSSMSPPHRGISLSDG